MRTILQNYSKFDAAWHFTDQANIASIEANGGLLSLKELTAREIGVAAPGGNQWSHDADARSNVDDYVHLAFSRDHPMLHIAKREERIKNPVWMKIDRSIVLQDGVRFTKEVANKSGTRILTADEARDQIDFDALFSYMDWRDPEVQQRRKEAVKSEILVPKIVLWNQILEWTNG
jgi:hypothetical protein